jgi:uncharacterized protein (TIGR03435 family)
MLKNYIGPLLGLALVSISGTTATAQQKAAEPATVTGDKAAIYDVASIRPSRIGSGGMISWYYLPDGLSAKNVTLQVLIQSAYGVEDYQISAAVKWLGTETFNVEAKVDNSVADKLRGLTAEQRSVEEQPMLQALLADRCKLQLHRETKELPVYALIVAKDGPKIQEAKPGDTYPNGIKGLDGIGRPGVTQFGWGLLRGQGVSMANLARKLSSRGNLGRPVVDKTGLTGKYDYTLKWTPDQGRSPMFKGPESGQQGVDDRPSPESSAPSLFPAIQEQLGLKLESTKAPVEILVIDHVEKPSEN